MKPILKIQRREDLRSTKRSPTTLKGASCLSWEKDFDQVVALMKEGHFLKAQGSNEAVGGNLVEFDGFDQVREDSRHSIYPHERGEVTCSLVTNPITSFEMVRERC